MDDQTTVAPSTGPAVEPPAGTAAAPVTASGAGAVQTAPRKRRPWWVWAIIGVVLIAIAAGGHLAWKTQAQSKASAAAAIDAETHWGLAALSLDTIENVAATLVITVPKNASKDIPEMASSLELMKDTATKELDAVATAVAVLPDGTAKAHYVTAIADARGAVAKAAGTVPALTALPDFYVGSAQVSAALDRARANVNAAVAAADDQKWAAAIASATKAQTDCKSALTTLGKLKAVLASQPGISEGGDIDAALHVVGLERTLAQRALDMARAGTGSISRYNAAVASYNKAVGAANKATLPRSFVSPVVFATSVLDTLRSAKELVGAANASHEDAVRAQA